MAKPKIVRSACQHAKGKVVEGSLHLDLKAEEGSQVWFEVECNQCHEILKIFCVIAYGLDANGIIID
jgi:hypothetical protein